MTVLLPDRLPILSRGKQEPGSGRVCAEQAAGWLVSGRLDLGDPTDEPSCVQPILNKLAIIVNDRLPDERRQELWPLILRQPGTARPDIEPSLSVHLAVWCARRAVDKVRGFPQHALTEALDDAMAGRSVRFGLGADPSRASSAVAYVCDGVRYLIAYGPYSATAVVALHMSVVYAAAAVRDAHSPCRRDDALLALLVGAQDEHARLTGHAAPPVDVARVERLGQLVGVA